MSKGNSDNGHGTVTSLGVSRSLVLFSALFMIIISTTFGFSPCMAGDVSIDDRSFQRLVFRSGPQGIELASVERVPSRRVPAAAADSASLVLSVIDKASGLTLLRHPLADRHRSAMA